MVQSTAGKLEPLLKLARKGPATPIAAYLDVGRFEADFYGRDLVDVAHRLRDALIAKGCRVRYQEVNEGHGWARTRDAVTFLFATDPMEAQPNPSKKISLVTKLPEAPSPALP